MKRALLAVAAWSLIGSSLADVTVNFSNAVFGDRGRIYKYGFQPLMPLVNSDRESWLAQLCLVSGGICTPIGDPAPFQAVAPSDPLAGTWVGGIRTIPGLPTDATVDLAVRVWDSTFSGFHAAAAGGGLANQSQTFSYRNALSSPPLESDFYMANFAGFDLMAPEPETYALVILGLGGLLLWHRRR